MTKSFRKTLIILFAGILILSCYFLIGTCFVKTSAQASSSSIYQQEEGVTVDTEYIMESGYLPRASAAKGFSGQKFLNTDNSSNIAGHMFSSVVDGAKVTLGEHFGEVLGYGKNSENVNRFSVIGTPIPNAKATSAQEAIGHSFSTLTFIITDNANENNVLEVVIKANTAQDSGYYGGENVIISAKYNGATLTGTGGQTSLDLYRSTFTSGYYGAKAHPFNFEFDRDGAKINIYELPQTFSQTINYLEDCSVAGGVKKSFEIANLSGFDSYTVDMKFSGFQDTSNTYNKEWKANVVLFEIAGQLLYHTNGNSVDTVGPMVTKVTDEVVTLKEYNLSDILSIYDMEEGFVTEIGNTEGKYSIKVDGVDCSSGKYTFTEERAYSLEYTIYDNFVKGSAAYTNFVKTISVTGVRDTVAPELSLDIPYKETYYKNMILSLLNIGVADNNDNSPTVSVEVFYKNGETWENLVVTENTVKLINEGEYKVKYTATDFSNNSAFIEDTFVVEEITLNVGNAIEEDYISEMFYVPQLVLGEELSYYVEKFEVSDTEFSNGERVLTRAIMFAEPTTFVLRYSIFSGNEENVIKTHVVTVTLKAISEELPQEDPNETPGVAGVNQDSFFTSVAFVIIISSILVASITFNIILLVKRRKNDKA